jgi:threonylcarbamoyladenosine tRNA methylthiotransferase MtaB
LPLVEVEQRLELLARESAQEVVICGINLGAWGKDLDPRQQLADLVSALETRAPVPRLRLSSIEPWAWRAEMVDVWAKAQRLAPSLHLPLQSGDDGTLKRMRRPYGADRFRRLLDQIWQVRPETAVSTDILVGFPGEEDEAFQRTKELIAELPLASLHVFGFSPRPGTAAATFPDQLPREVIRDRVAQLRALGQEKKRSYGQSLHGSTVSVLFDGWDEALGELKGVEDHGFAVLVPSQEPLTGLWSVRIDSSRSTGELVGRLRSKRVIS